MKPIRNRFSAHFFTLGTALALASLPSHADGPRPGPPDEGFRKAITACFKKLGLAEPTPGNPPPPLTEEQRKQLDQCLKDAGYSPPTGGRQGPPPQSQSQSRMIEPADSDSGTDSGATAGRAY